MIELSLDLLQFLCVTDFTSYSLVKLNASVLDADISVYTRSKFD